VRLVFTRAGPRYVVQVPEPRCPIPGWRAYAVLAFGPNGDGGQHRSTAASAKPPDGGSCGPVVAWWQVPCNQVNAGQFRAFAMAYAKAKGVKAIGWEDVRRDFAIEGSVVDYFGATPLGQIVERVRRDRRSAEPADSPEAAVDQGSSPDSEAA